MPSAKKHIREIDFFRGVAALWVAWFHLYTQNANIESQGLFFESLNRFTVWGRFGVQLFFVVSGFVLTYTLYFRDRIKSIPGVLRYFVRRSVRLDGVYYFSLLAYLIGVPCLKGLESVGIYYSSWQLVDFQTIARNVFYFLPNALYDSTKIVPVVWTLVIEVQFYFFYALSMVCACWLTRRFVINSPSVESAPALKIAILCLWGLVAMPWSLGMAPWIHLNALPVLSVFLMGVVVCLAWKNEKYWQVPFLIIFVPCLFSPFLKVSSGSEFAGLVASAALYCGLQVKVFSRIASLGIWQFLGNASYSIYLLHSLIGGLVIEFLQTVSPVESFYVVYALAGLFVTILVSALVYRVIEVPCISASKKIILDAR